jgi:hypothetical protein
MKKIKKKKLTFFFEKFSIKQRKFFKGGHFAKIQTKISQQKSQKVFKPTQSCAIAITIVISTIRFHSYFNFRQLNN